MNVNLGKKKKNILYLNFLLIVEAFTLRAISFVEFKIFEILTTMWNGYQILSIMICMVFFGDILSSINNRK